MNYLLTCLIGITLLTACHPSSVNQEGSVRLAVNESDAFEGDVIPGEVLYGPASGPESFTATTQADFAAIARDMREQSRKLASLRPFPRYREGVRSIGWEQAHRRYKDALTKLGADPIRAVFQQRYARLMLLEYEPLFTDRADIKQYYVNQLLDGGSREFRLMTDGMESGKRASATTDYQTTLDRLIVATQKRALTEQKDIAGLTTMLQKQRADAKARQSVDIWSRGTEIVLEKMKGQETDKQLARQQRLAAL